MKKRIISLLAIIAMLSSMVVVALPAAAADDADLAPYKAVLEDVASGAVNLSAEVAKGAETTANALLAAAQADASAIEWKTFDWKNEPYPRYAYKDAYAAAGYAEKVYMISEAADWLAMVADSNAETDPLNFKGYTFHLNQTVDFTGIEDMTPLNFNKGALNGNSEEKVPGCYFHGTIDGHGYGFKNIDVSNSITGNNITVGLIGKVGVSAVIKNFGVDSGTIKATGTYQYAATFGEIIESAEYKADKASARHAVLQNVWSGADLIADGTGSNVAGFYGQSQYSQVVLNGGYFFGSLQTGTTGDATAYDRLALQFNNTKCTYTYNSIGAPKSTDGVDGLVYHQCDANYYQDQINNYAVNTPVIANMPSGHTCESNVRVSGNGSAASAIEAAYLINKAQATFTADENVYYTLNANNDIRPTSDATNQIIKVTVSGATNQTFYMNANTDLSMAAFAEKAGVALEEIEKVEVDGTAHDLSAPLNFGADANVKVTTTVDVSVLLEEALAQYADLDVKHLAAADAGKVSLKDFRDAAAAAGEDKVKIQAVLDMIPNLQIKVTEVVADLPVFSDYAIYKDYNENQNWLIKTADDWKAMMTAADASTTKNSKGFTNYFKGMTFHLTNDVDFKEAGAIAPMGVGKMFAGTIDGHSYGFSNITVNYSGGGYVGLVCGFEGTFKDFGINSGTFTISDSPNEYAAMALIGAYGVSDSKQFETTPVITRVWNHANMVSTGKAAVGGLVSQYMQDSASVVNGFYFGGTISAPDSINKLNSPLFSGNSRGVSVYNVIGDSTGDQIVCYGNQDTYIGATLKNVYGIGVTNLVVDYSGKPYADQTLNAGLKYADSAFEAAMKINAAQDPTDDIEDVYFVVKNGKLCFGAKENRVRKVTLTGFNTGVYYFSANTAIDLVEEFGFVPSGQAATVIGSASSIDGTILKLGDEDVTLNIILDCDHAEGFTYTATENAHIKACKLGCGYSCELPCTAESYTNNAPTFEQILAGTNATHSGTCEFCGGAFTQDCTVTYTVSGQAGVENYWDYSACDCGRENIVHKGAADMLAGDANADGRVDLLDAVRMLRKIAQYDVEINMKNADIDGNSVLDVAEVRKVIRYWLGNPQMIAEVENHQNYMNTENLFDRGAAIEVRLNQDGTEVASDAFVVSSAIAVKKGYKVTFGPVRPTQVVYGYAYDAQMNPIKPIAFDNTKVVLTFVNKAVLVSYEVPEGVAFIKLQAETEYADAYVARFNSNMTLIEYETRMGVNSAEFENILKGKTVLTVGDSICEAARDYADANGLRGWARHIAKDFGANVTNSGVSGAAFSDCRYNRSGVPTAQIYHQIGQHIGTKSFDYILLHGGVNDAWDDIAVGTVSDSFNPDDFDLTTYAGGMEMAIYTAVKNYGDTAAIGYLINFNSPLHENAKDSGKYFEVGKEICEKWGIKYLDLYTLDFDTSVYTADTIHPNAAGYEVLAPHINGFMTEMRPVSYDIYSKVN